MLFLREFSDIFAVISDCKLYFLLDYKRNYVAILDLTTAVTSLSVHRITLPHVTTLGYESAIHITFCTRARLLCMRNN